MIPSSRRLTTALFKEVILKGKPLHSPIFVLRMLVSQGTSRFSVSVPKKVAKSAVLRNKIRRRLYSALQPTIPHIKAGIQGVFMVKQVILGMSFENIVKNLQDFFGKSGLLK
jgi:ribonuclease P protein component